MTTRIPPVVSPHDSRSRAVPLKTHEIAAFRRDVYRHFRREGRDLPWRRTRNPFHILVAEVMLQQTQVPRVIEKYGEFLKTFPDAASLARASLRRVMKCWQGMGYNRRALSLKRAAVVIMADFGGRVPRDEEALVSLPGIGKATARAIRAFAFNEPVIFIETNIRAVYIHHFFHDGQIVSDEKILPLVEATLDRRNPRRWYNALMDYGSYLKKIRVNPSRRSALWRRQAPFAGSNRQVRGAIVRELLSRGHMTVKQIADATGFSQTAVRKNIDAMKKEGILVRCKKGLQLAT